MKIIGLFFVLFFSVVCSFQSFAGENSSYVIGTSIHPTKFGGNISATVDNIYLQKEGELLGTIIKNREDYPGALISRIFFGEIQPGTYTKLNISIRGPGNPNIRCCLEEVKFNKPLIIRENELVDIGNIIVYTPSRKATLPIHYLLAKGRYDASERAKEILGQQAESLKIVNLNAMSFDAISTATRREILRLSNSSSPKVEIDGVVYEGNRLGEISVKTPSRSFDIFTNEESAIYSIVKYHGDVLAAGEFSMLCKITGERCIPYAHNLAAGAIIALHLVGESLIAVVDNGTDVQLYKTNKDLLSFESVLDIANMHPSYGVGEFRGKHSYKDSFGGRYDLAFYGDHLVMVNTKTNAAISVDLGVFDMQKIKYPQNVISQFLGDNAMLVESTDDGIVSVFYESTDQGKSWHEIGSKVSETFENLRSNVSESFEN